MLLTEPSVGEVADTAPRERDEGELVRRAQLGSAAAFEQLVLARGPQLYRFLVVRLRDEADARDALQETLTAAWLGLPRLQETSRFWPWLCGIAAHKAVDAARARGRVAEPAEVPAPERSGALEIREAIAELPEPLQHVLLLRYLLGLSESEAAKALGIRVGTVKSRTARARTAFREVWR